MTMETHADYAQRIGPPRVVRCNVDLLGYGPTTRICRTHDYRFNDYPSNLMRNGIGDRCPMSRLEEWRARRWAAVA